MSPTPLERAGPRTTISATFAFPPLYPGRYDFEVTLTTSDGVILDKVESVSSFTVSHDEYLGSTHPYFPEMGLVLVPSRWSASERNLEPAG